MRRALASLAPLAIVLAGCGTLGIRPSGAEQSIIQVVSSKIGVHPTHVICPSGVPAKVGTNFDCHFLALGNVRYVAHMHIIAVHGTTVKFFIVTRPAGH